MPVLTERYYYGNSGYGYGYGNSSWNSWIRWLVMGLIIGAALLIFILFACCSSRRRRRAGAKPMYGTGWATYGQNINPRPQYQQQQTGYYNNSNNPPPMYQTAPPTNGYYGQATPQHGQNASYYGNSRDEPVSQPEQVYAPPKGPPPGHRV